MSVLAKRSKKGGVCPYCHKWFSKLTKEHIVPKCFGGVLTIKVCADCNNRRNNSLHDPSFEKWRKTHEKEFWEAVRRSTDPKQTWNWLHDFKNTDAFVHTLHL